MQQTFGADLRAARKRCGLSQEDCAHLLGIEQSQISKLEAGKAEPTLEELTLFYLVFGAWSLPLWSGLLRDLVTTLRERLVTLPEAEPSWPQKAARKTTLDVLAQRLYGLDENDDA
jgi:transcriptional regulator with XRE-family HTH domain